MRRLAAETSGVDDGVGEILATLKRLGIDERTLVVYSADQGWMGGQNGIWGMGDHTRPIGAFESCARRSRDGPTRVTASRALFGMDDTAAAGLSTKRRL
jgi:hypothetical protein